MKVCKLFHSICEPVLYRHIVTTDFASLFQRPYTPSAKRRFAHTRSLSIEYKPYRNRESTYEDLMRIRGDIWIDVAPTRIDGERMTNWRCGAEVQGLLDALIDLGDIGMGELLPRLETIAVAPFSGWWRDEKEWTWRRHLLNSSMPDMEGNMPEGDASTASTNLIECSEAFASWIDTGNLQHVCVRDHDGPLSFPSGSKDYTYTSSTCQFTRTAHLTKADMKMPIFFGAPMNWVSDIPTGDSWFNILNQLRTPMMINLRDRLKAEKIVKLPIQAANLTTYASTSKWRPNATSSENQDQDTVSWPDLLLGGLAVDLDQSEISEENQRIMAEAIGRKLKRMAGQHKGDEIRCKSSFDIPRCPACGTGPPPSGPCTEAPRPRMAAVGPDLQVLGHLPAGV